MEVDQKMQLKGIQVMCRSSQQFEFFKISNTPWHGAVDQDSGSKLCTPKCASQPRDASVLALLSLPSQSGKGALTEVWHVAHFWVSYGRCAMP